MGLLERIQAALNPPTNERTWPVGKGVVLPTDRIQGHDDSLFSPESYGSYLVTSAEIFGVVSLRARLMSGLHLQLFRGYGPSRKEITTGPAVDLLRKVNPFWTAARLARMDELAMCLWGETYWAVERGPDGMPTEIWWLKPSRVRPVPHESGYLSGFLYEPVLGGKPIPFTADEIVWFRYPNPLDEFSALSPLAAARLAADTGHAMMTANRKLFDNGMMAGGLIVPTTDKVVFSAEQAGELENLLDKRWTGADKAHRWSVLRFEAQLKELGVSARDAEFLGGLNLSLRQVCNAYGVPSPLLNDMEHATLANVRELLTAVWSLTLVPDSQLKSAEITEQLLPMFPSQRRPDFAEYDYTRVPELQEAASEVWARERQAIESGRKTINEVRLQAGEPPVPWGDVWWCPVNKFAVSAEDSAPGSDGPEDTDAEDVEAAGQGRDKPQLINALGVLIRTGFEPAASLRALGLDPIKHLGLLPITLAPPAEGEATLPAPSEADTAAALKAAAEAAPADDADDPLTDDDPAERALLLAAFDIRPRSVNGHKRSS